MSEVHIEPSWKKCLSSVFEQEHMRTLRNTVRSLYLDPSKRIYPSPSDVFRAFDLCPVDSVSVVILGQDPYHGADRHMDFRFQSLRGRTRLHHCRIFLRRFGMTLVPSHLQMVTLLVGQSKVFFF